MKFSGGEPLSAYVTQQPMLGSLVPQVSVGPQKIVVSS